MPLMDPRRENCAKQTAVPDNTRATARNKINLLMSTPPKSLQVGLSDMTLW